MARNFRMGRFGFLVWLIAPVILVAVLWTQMDRSRGERDPRFMTRKPTPGTSATSQAQPSETSAPSPAGPASEPTPAKPAPEVAPAPRPELVEPESLAQGYIILVTDESKTATADSPIFLASSHNGWNPSDTTQRLTPRSDGKWQIVMAKPRLDSRLAFKFTRGNWDSVEVSAELNDIDNRMLPTVDIATLAPGEQPVLEFRVSRWADQRPRGADAMAASPYRAIKVAGGTIQRVQVTGGGVPITRDLIVWLPPGYHDPANAQRTYPVLYMQDGQNLFDRMPGVPGEWEADEAATKLIAEGTVEPLIIVGIPHSGEFRASEYLPVPALGDVEPRADAYVEFVVSEVMPRIERTFRVRRGPEHTGMGGSSLGGLVSLYAGLKRPDVFGHVLAESPSVYLRGEALWRTAFDGFTRPVRSVFIGVGGREAGDGADEHNARFVEEVRGVSAWLRDRSLATNVELKVDEEARHTESAWAERFPAALRFLFPAKP